MTSAKLYSAFAHWWPLFSPKEDYAEEAGSFHEIFQTAVTPPPKTMVEFGSGGGSNAYYLKSHYRMTLVEPSAGMLAVSQALNPDCEHLTGDMRSVRLERVFDAVFIHDAIMYLTTKDDLRRAFETAFVHLKAGGIALIAPDFVRETFRPSTDHGGEDGDGRSMRWLEWTFDPNPTDTVISAHYVLMFKEGDRVRMEHDAHSCGVFDRDIWLRLLQDCGFQTRIVVDIHNRDLFVALKP